jgi:hypothetical protein
MKMNLMEEYLGLSNDLIGIEPNQKYRMMER